MSKILEFEKLAGVRMTDTFKIVHCHGVFDVLHAGHLEYLRSAKAHGDILVVTITSDRHVNKGPGRPHFSDRVRAMMIAALEVVDFVSISDHATALPAINLIKPHFYVKGPDYRDKTKDVSGGIYEEESAVESHGGKLVFTDDEMFSSSELVNKFFMDWSDEQKQVIAKVRESGGLEKILAVLDSVSRLKVCVVGEPIIDTYRFVNPENISSKSPSVSARFLEEQNYAGGSLAIANHLAGFVKETRLVFTCPASAEFEAFLFEKLDRGIYYLSWPLEGTSVPRKTRYISKDNSQRIFEVTDIVEDQWKKHSPKNFVGAMLDHSFNCDAVVIADFGHGLFQDEVLSACSQFRPFIGLNVQTNSSNYGFNVFHKHKRFDYLSLDMREARIAYHDKRSSPIDIGRRARKDLNPHSASVSMTLGGNGSLYFPAGIGHEYFSPTFADQVIDATGAGDAFFGLTTLLVRVGCPSNMVPFIGNVFAGLKTKIIGNKSAVTKAQLVKAITSILK